MKSVVIKDCITQCPYLLELEDKYRVKYYFCEKLSKMLKIMSRNGFGFPEECPLEEVE
jgi:hypothetical protein